MKTREEKYQAILDHAVELVAKKKTEDFIAVSRFLNKRGFRNNAGGFYAAHPRGVAKVIKHAYVYACETYNAKKAFPITKAFTGMHGEYFRSTE